MECANGKLEHEVLLMQRVRIETCEIYFWTLNINEFPQFYVYVTYYP